PAKTGRAAKQCDRLAPSAARPGCPSSTALPVLVGSVSPRRAVQPGGAPLTDDRAPFADGRTAWPPVRSWHPDERHHGGQAVARAILFYFLGQQGHPSRPRNTNDAARFSETSSSHLC